MGGTACLKTIAMRVLLFVGNPLFPKGRHFCYTVLGVRPLVLLSRVAFEDKTSPMPFLYPKSRAAAVSGRQLTASSMAWTRRLKLRELH
jgi:hypothetical protein